MDENIGVEMLLIKYSKKERKKETNLTKRALS